MNILKRLFKDKSILDEKDQCEYCLKYFEPKEIFVIGCEDDGMVGFGCRNCYEKYFEPYPNSFCKERGI